MGLGGHAVAQRVGFEPTDGCPSTDFESMLSLVGWWYLVASVSICGRRKSLDLCGFIGWSGLETRVAEKSPVEQVFGMFVSWRLAENESTLRRKDFWWFSQMPALLNIFASSRSFLQ